MGSSREQSASPPPLPPDANDLKDKARDGRYGTMDPRRFTPTLHASLVSEILNLRRELDSKNYLVENLESNLSSAKTENEALTDKLSDNAKEVRKAKMQVQQMEQGTFDVVEDLAKERDNAKGTVEDLKSKLEAAQRSARRQDDDIERNQQIWESEKERWDNERRQMERRIHVTESRLR
jgi:chromosome segregation ATPase